LGITLFLRENSSIILEPSRSSISPVSYLTIISTAVPSVSVSITPWANFPSASVIAIILGPTNAPPENLSTLSNSIVAPLTGSLALFKIVPVIIQIVTESALKGV